MRNKKTREKQKHLKMETLEDLRKEIEKIRDELYHSISNNENEINRGKTLILSQKLDRIIVRYLSQKENIEKGYEVKINFIY